jgi:hypothetical protein
MSSEITTPQAAHSILPTGIEWATMKAMAECFVNSKALPTEMNAPRLMMVLQAAKDMGMSVTEAVNGTYFVSGRLTVFGAVALAQVKKSGYKVEFIGDAKKATCTISKDGQSATHTVTFEDAVKRARNADMFNKYPENMLRWKAFAFVARFFCPEALAGFYLKEEMEAEATAAKPAARASVPRADVIDAVAEEYKPAQKTAPALKNEAKAAQEDKDAIPQPESDPVHDAAISVFYGDNETPVPTDCPEHKIRLTPQGCPLCVKAKSAATPMLAV